MRWAVYLTLLVLSTTLVVAAYPRLQHNSDGTNFIATAFKMGREGKLTAATHHHIDVVRHGLDHKHVKMPAYTLVLAAWLAITPEPGQVRILNVLLFVGAVLVLLALFRANARRAHWETGLVAAILFTTPLGLAYANTAMMESLVLLTLALHLAAWFAPLHDGWRLPAIYLSGFLAFITKEILLLISLSLIITRLAEIARLHRQTWQKSRGGFLALCIGVAGLAFTALSLYRQRGFYPNFRNELSEAADLASAFEMLWRNLEQNLARFLSWSDFPHDYLYGYALMLFALTLLAAWLSRRTPHAKGLLATALAWGISLPAVCGLYDNFDWRSHRVFGLVGLTATILGLRWLSDHAGTRLRVGVLVAGLLVQVPLCIAVNQRFIRTRAAHRPGQHVLTQLGLPRPGDCLLSSRDHHFLAENPHCELIWNYPDQPAEVLALLRRARPRFAILPAKFDLRPEGYRSLAKIETVGRKAGISFAWMRRDR